MKELALASAHEEEIGEVHGLLGVALTHLVTLGEVVAPDQLLGGGVGGDDLGCALREGDGAADPVDNAIVGVDVLLLHL